VASTEVPGLGFWALTWTSWDWSRFVSDWLLQNDGTWVENRVVGVAFASVRGYLILVAKVPWIVSPLEEIDFTWPASTCWTKYGLNGTFTRGCPPERTISSDTQLIASSTNKKIQNPLHRCGGGGLGCSGIPRPSGARATRQPRSSCGSGGGGTSFWAVPELISVTSLDAVSSCGRCRTAAGRTGRC